MITWVPLVCSKSSKSQELLHMVNDLYQLEKDAE